MKLIYCLAAIIGLCSPAFAQSPAQTSAPTPAAPLPSMVYEWTKLQPKPTATGERRALFDGQTTSLDKLHGHITTLQPGKVSSEPYKHKQEEIIIIKEGTIEVHLDGQLQNAGPGSVLFFAAGAVTRLKNIGDIPATYYVLSYFTPATPKN